MLLPMILNSVNALSREQMIRELVEMNAESKEFGLELTPQDAAQVLDARNRSLQQLGRIELGIGASKAIIQSFCNSSFLLPEEYAAALSELHEIFYYIKNETEDKIGDDVLIKMMREYFEDSCGGSLELLKGKLASYAEEFRKKTDLTGLIKKEE